MWGGWKYLVDIIAGVAGKHPQTAYAGLNKSLQQEWYFVQRVTLNIGTEFQPIEDALRNNLRLYLFKGDTYHIIRRAVTGMPVNQAGISLPYPTDTSRTNCAASCVINGHIVPALQRTAEFRSVDHDLLMVDGRDKICWQHAEDAETALGQAWATTST